MESIIGKNIGKYRIVEHLGSGGMAEVYKAHQPSLDRYVAIKLMHPFLAQDAEFRGRFEREAKAVAALRHSNIIQVHDFDIEGGQYYMVMEFIDGPTLRRRIEDIYGHGRRLPIPEVIRIIKDVGSALAYAHKRGMVHRDVKPANVMMDSSDRVVLTDFGIAKILAGPQYTASGAMVGTPAYMAPEIGLGKPGDGRSDIYALGVMLYQLLTGRVPYDADTPVAVMMKHVNEPLPMPRSINPEIPEGLERIILKAMAKNPADRYQTVDEMVKHLSNLEAAARIQYPSGTTVMDGVAYMAATVADLPPAQATVAEMAATRPATVVAGEAVSGPAVATAVAPPEERKRRFPCLVVGIVLAVIAVLAIVGGGVALGASGRLGGLASLFAAPTPPPTATATPEPSPTPLLSPTPDVNATNNAIIQMTNAALITALAPTATPDAAATAAACVYGYSLEKTDPGADTVLGVNKPFTLTLDLRNSGNCAWPKGTLFTLKEGDQLEAKPVIDVPSVEPGQAGRIEVAMQAPGSAGSASQTWALRLPDGRLMGSPIALTYQIGTAAAGGTAATGERSVDGTFVASASNVSAGQSVTLSWDLKANQDFIFSAEIWEFATGATQPRKHSIATAIKQHSGSQAFSPTTTTTYELNLFYNDKDEKAVVQKKSVTVTVGGAAGGTTGGTTTGGPSGGPLQIRRAYSTGRSERIANTNDAYFIISVEFTGGTGPYTLTGDGMQDFGGSQTFNANLSADRTFFWIEFRMRGGCGGLNPATVRITDSAGQTAAQSYAAGGDCP